MLRRPLCKHIKTIESNVLNNSLKDRYTAIMECDTYVKPIEIQIIEELQNKVSIDNKCGIEAAIEQTMSQFQNQLLKHTKRASVEQWTDHVTRNWSFVSSNSMKMLLCFLELKLHLTVIA